jgi:uncharacterized protein (DUF1778 family)
VSTIAQITYCDQLALFSAIHKAGAKAMIDKGTVLTYVYTPLAISIQEHNVTAPATKKERINLRLKESAKSLIERAAAFEGKTVSSFILSSAVASAEKTVHEHESLQLNEQDAQRFFDALAKPVRFNEKLTEALVEHDRRVDSK